ncbi:MFS transporter [Pseudonocardia sp. C8]|nr:MFS transporter [Pseudonocardia sp. C8]
MDLRHGTQRVFAHLLASTLTVSVVNFTVWFAVTFWVFLETRSIMATGIIAGIFLAATSLTGIPFGGIVDHFGKKAVLQASAAVSATIYLGCLGTYLLVPAEEFRDPGSPVLWAFVVALMLGVITGNLRTIALPTLVTLLVPAPVRDRANGLVGTATGVSFLVTSVLSGLLVAFDGMRSVLVVAVVALGASLLHLARVRVPSAPAAAPSADGGGRGIDLRGTLQVVRSVPGLPALIVFTCVNNLLGGVFMALMDPYGLSLVSVQAWGLLWGALSTLVIIGGLLVARTGLGSRPVRTLLLVNAVLWTSTMLFPLQASIVTLTVGMAVFMLLMPYAEAAEQTVLQRVVPYHRQGRVFGFAQSVEQAASPLTAFLLAPVTELVVVPFMTDGAGARTVGPWFGTGADRAIALVFVVAGLLGLVLTLAALASGPYRRLSTAYLTAPRAEPAPHAEHAPAPGPHTEHAPAPAPGPRTGDGLTGPAPDPVPCAAA